jgi:hypothetical protein
MDIWECKLRIFAGQKPDASWGDQLKSFLSESGWVNYSTERSLHLDRTLHSLCKSNAGKFKSDAQANLILSKLDETHLRPHERLEDPRRWVEVTVNGRVIEEGGIRDYLSVQKVFGKEGRYSAYGFILDESGVVAKIKFHVNTKITESTTLLGQVDYSSGEVVWSR